MKIDVEGFEDRVITGMQRTLQRWRLVLLVEANPDGPVGAVEALLRGLGYVFRPIDPSRPAESDRIVPDQSGRYRNVTCLPRERAGGRGALA